MSETNGRPIVLLAMGGHAFMKRDEKGDINDHERNATAICASIMTLVERDYNLVVTHGNGPQVGNLLLQNELTLDSVPSMPLDVLVANTEGFLGYVLQQALLNQLRRRQIKRYVVTMITQVLVEGDDPAFQNPSKPIGPFLTKEQAEDRRDRLGWKIVEDSGRGWRRLVASPRPVRVVQRFMIRDSARAGHIVVACGGGGIPIIRNQEKDYVGVEAVIDKDLTSSVLAAEIGAELLIILTDVPQVYVNYGQPSQRALGAVTLEEIEALQSEGHFGRGSMGPKVEAIINFLKAGGKRGLVTSPACLADALDGRAGTHFVGKI
ncbi:MAG TPA: carbamate kinase [Candidatus Sulfotelmatobacter sp.]|nr:carbamate kinase [Candidatus Sulfotelmatobacter sp.]